MLNYIYLIIYRKKIITALKADTCATSVAKNQKWEVKKWERILIQETKVLKKS